MIDRNQLKILLLDTEFSYALYYGFPSNKPQYLNPSQLKESQYCPNAAWKWHHQASIYSISVTDDPKRFKKNFRDDYIIAKKMHSLMEEADIIVAHNADGFDIKMLNALFLKHDLGPIPEKKSIDTLKVARKYFKFEGNGLDFLSKKFGGSGKKFKPCWKKLTEGDAKEIKKSARYCKIDVKELERVFNKIKPYIRNIPIMKVIGDIKECSACGCKKVNKRGPVFYNNKLMQRYKCMAEGCGHEMKGKYKPSKIK